MANYGNWVPQQQQAAPAAGAQQAAAGQPQMTPEQVQALLYRQQAQAAALKAGGGQAGAMNPAANMQYQQQLYRGAGGAPQAYSGHPGAHPAAQAALMQQQYAAQQRGQTQARPQAPGMMGYNGAVRPQGQMYAAQGYGQPAYPQQMQGRGGQDTGRGKPATTGKRKAPKPAGGRKKRGSESESEPDTEEDEEADDEYVPNRYEAPAPTSRRPVRSTRGKIRRYDDFEYNVGGAGEEDEQAEEAD